MEIKELGIWLRGEGSFEEGKQLYLKYYEKYGGSHLTVHLINEETPYSRKKLREGLQKIHQVSSQPIAKKRDHGNEYQDIKVESLPEDLKRKRFKAKELWAERDHLTGVLRNLAYDSKGFIRKKYDQKKIYELSKKIVQNHQKAQRLWEELDYFVKNGERMPDTGFSGDPQIDKWFALADSNEEIKEILRMIANLEKAINTHRNRARTAKKENVEAAVILRDRAQLVKKIYTEKYER